MSSKNKKSAPPPTNKNQKSAPPIEAAPPPAPLQQYELGTYFTSVKPESWSILFSPTTSKFELLARDRFGTDHRVIAAPTLNIARSAARFCQDVLSDSVARPENSPDYPLVDLISSYWDDFFKQCAEMRIDPIEMEQMQREARHAKELVASLRTEPLIRFGLAACARSDIKGFVIRQGGGVACRTCGSATWAIFLIDKSGASHFCKTGGPDSEEELSRDMDDYIKKANQQFIDTELRAQCALSKGHVFKTFEVGLTMGIPQEAPSAAEFIFQESLNKKRTGGGGDDEDEDVDDKDVKPEEKVAKIPSNGPRFDLTVRENKDAATSVEVDKDKTEFVRAIDPATIAAAPAPAPHDGKMTLAKNTETAIVLADEFLPISGGPSIDAKK
jgi:hypothetical protein